MEKIPQLLQSQRKFFESGATLEVSFRFRELKKLHGLIRRHEKELIETLHKDLGKPPLEAFLVEFNHIVQEIDFVIANLSSWVKPQKRKTPFLHQMASSHIHPQPYGIALIIGPWNYPVTLLLAPLIGAMAAGNCSCLKPSEISEHTSAFLEKLLRDTFDESYISVVSGGVETSKTLLSQRFDYIFFTGSVPVGKIVMAAAARHLTPVTLELGGKNPCVIDESANLKCAARRLAWGKFINAGQSCTSPDYLLINRKIKEPFLVLFEETLKSFFTADPKASPDFGRIINEQHFDRLSSLMEEGTIRVGGDTDRSQRYISPTVIEDVTLESVIMQEEIFGPLLPTFEFTDLGEAMAVIRQLPHPLALYFFTENKEDMATMLESTTSGGVCINDTIIHTGTSYLPFGGVGDSGMGSYHGKASFDTFTHYKSVMKRTTLFDVKLRYPPYKGKLPILRKLT